MSSINHEETIPTPSLAHSTYQEESTLRKCPLIGGEAGCGSSLRPGVRGLPPTPRQAPCREIGPVSASKFRRKLKIQIFCEWAVRAIYCEVVKINHFDYSKTASQGNRELVNSLSTATALHALAYCHAFSVNANAQRWSPTLADSSASNQLTKRSQGMQESVWRIKLFVKHIQRWSLDGEKCKLLALSSLK